MANWWETIKKEATSNTIKNPLDSMFPNFRPAEEKKVVPSPVKEKAKTTIQDTKDVITDFKAKVTPIIFFGGIALIVYLFSSKK